jgi:predicted dehydrogenase
VTAKIRWGILATGAIAASFTADLQKMPDAQVVAVGSRHIDSAKRFANRFGIKRAYGSWTELADDDDVDIVYIAGPHSAHRAAAGLCLQAGRAVLCEKAFTVNAAEARELVDLAGQYQRLLMEAMWMYCNPVIRNMAELVQDGAIGAIRAVHADFGLAGPFPPEHRLRDPAQAGGALLDLGVYPVAFTQLLLGEPDDVRAWAHLTPEGVDDNTGVLLGYDTGAVALLSCSLSADTAQTASITGSAGRIEFPRGFYCPDRYLLHRPGREPEQFTDPAVPSHGLRYEAAEAMRCLRAGELQSPLASLDSTLGVMRTLDAIRDRIGVRYVGEA